MFKEIGKRGIPVKTLDKLVRRETTDYEVTESMATKTVELKCSFVT